MWRTHSLRAAPPLLPTVATPGRRGVEWRHGAAPRSAYAASETDIRRRHSDGHETVAYKVNGSVGCYSRLTYTYGLRGISSGVHGAWPAGDIAGRLPGSRKGDLDGANDRAMTGGLFEHKVASVLKHTPLLRGKGFAPVDDDYYYEMVAIRAFEKYGIHLIRRTIRSAVARK